MGVFVSTKFAPECDDRLHEFVVRNKIPQRHAQKHYHTTLVYSKSDFAYVPSTMLNGTIARPAGWDVFGVGDNSVLVLRIESKELHERNKQLMEAGATSDFPDYKPHITIACATPDFDYKSLPLPQFDFKIAHEYQTEIALGSTWDAKKLVEGAFTNFKIHVLLERLFVRPREAR